MTQKRDRAAYETDLRGKQSRNVAYGTPLPSLDSEVRDDGSYVPVWKQEVVDERGRKRLHGAFTGGFSAGYFNTVGSKEGWTPSTFVSSRAKRKKDTKDAAQQKPEDFMDDEDLADAAEAIQPDSADAFAGLGSRADVSRDGLLADLIRNDDTMGTKLLQKMGWREGQGIGPKVRRKARLDGDEMGAEEAETHLFAPDDSVMVTFPQKTDQKGLGYTGEVRLSTAKPDDNDDDNIGALVNSLATSKNKKKIGPRTGFGVGILNDTGSDDEDPYSIGPSISYNRTITSSKSKKPPKAKRPLQNANPLISSKPVYISKASKSSTFRRCHDSRLPLPGFVLALHAYSPPKTQAPPEIPPGWKSSKTPLTTPPTNSFTSTAQAAKDSTLNPSARASILGETPLPSASVFTFLTPEARARLVAKTHNPNLPEASYVRPAESTKASKESASIPPLSPTLALSALNPSTTAFQPYTSDPAKLDRYTAFLRYRGNLSTSPPSRPSAFEAREWTAELAEFAHAAQIFRPASGLMAQRFTSSSSSASALPQASNPQSSSTDYQESNNGEGPGLLRTGAHKKEDPATEAALMGLYGPLTRSTSPWMPTRLLCKRFGVRVPEPIAADPIPPFSPPHASATGTGYTSQFPVPNPTPASSTPQPKPLLSSSTLDELISAASNSHPLTSSSASSLLPALTTQGDPKHGAGVAVEKSDPGANIDISVNEALEKERPGMDVFRAVFGSDSEDDDDDDK